MHSREWFLIGCLAMITSCVSVADLPRPPSVSGPIPTNTRSLALRVLPPKPEAMISAGSLTDAGPLLAGYIKDAVALKQPSWDIKIVEATASQRPDSDLFASTEILSIDGGSRALRFWIGFSAGATNSTAAVSLTDKSDKQLAQATIAERTMCPLGVCTDSNEDNIQRNLKNLAEEIASFISNPAGYQKEK